MRKCCELDTQHLMRGERGHPPFETLGGVDPAVLHIGDDIVVNVLEVAELLVEMPGQEQRAVGQFALADLDCTLAKSQGEVSGAERDRHHQRGTAQHEPLDSAQPEAKPRAGLSRPSIRQAYVIR